ncbi:MAG: hypothetical protein J1E82_06995 [Muribaculaceae bacterium]|nr:hypothetical protein [Muribaculaceae bacterium]
MSDKELNSYRFSSGEDPTDEMLAAIMKEVAEDATKKQKEAEIKMKFESQKEYDSFKDDILKRVMEIKYGK